MYICIRRRKRGVKYNVGFQQKRANAASTNILFAQSFTVEVGYSVNS